MSLPEETGAMGIVPRQDEIERTGSRLDQIFEFHGAIRFVAIIGKDGKVLERMNRPNFVSLEPEDVTAGVFVRAVIASAMAESMNPYHGKVKTAIIIKEKVVLICFLTPRQIYFIATDPNFPTSEVERLGQVLDELNLA